MSRSFFDNRLIANITSSLSVSASIRLTVATLVSMFAVPDGRAAQDLKPLIDVMGSDAPAASKQQAGAELVRSGKLAIPVLIASLHDTRVYEMRDIANRMNLPSNAAQPKALMAKITVGERCEHLLYQIITPAPSASVATNSKVISEQVLLVKDWNRWWTANRTRSLESIHAELQPLVDAYWKQRGTTQLVPVPNAGSPARSK